MSSGWAGGDSNNDDDVEVIESEGAGGLLGRCGSGGGASGELESELDSLGDKQPKRGGEPGRGGSGGLSWV